MPFVPNTGQTAFGIYDQDPQFQIDADKMLDFVFRKLGDPVMQVELTPDNVYEAFEESCLEYSAIINMYQAKSVLSTLLGTPTGSLAGHENQYPNKSLALQKRLAEPYGNEVGVGNVNIMSASIMTVVGQAKYDLNPFVTGTGSFTGGGSSQVPAVFPTGSDGRPLAIHIREIYHPDPLSAFRFFGTTSAVNYLNNQFSFESFTPETIFYLLPIWEDVLRGMQFKQSNKVRRSNYSYDLHHNELTLYPSPQASIPLFFHYVLDTEDPYEEANPGSHSTTGVANLSNVPFGNIQYSALNSIGKHWIRRMTVALAKEVLGRIRGKMQTIPIPNGDLQLDGNELITDAKAEQDNLRSELKELLEDTTYDKLIAREAQMAQDLQNTIKEVPLGIYIG
jgi:hypothetical protein